MRTSAIEPDDEETLRADAQIQEFTDFYNAIVDRPDGEIVLARACAILKILADGPVEGAGYWPTELDC